MSTHYVQYPNIGAVPTYANAAALPPTATHGDLAVTLDSNSLYEFDGTSWIPIATPGDVTAITALTSDVTANGPGSVAATVNSVGGQSAANIASSTITVGAATSANTPNTLVKRDGSGNFAAGTITASLTGTASGNVVNTRNVNTTSPLLGGGPLSSDLTLSIQQANTSQSGFLSSTDWNTFNNKSGALIFSAPLVNTSGTISITQSGVATNGFLSSTDWNTFNNKQPAGSYITALTGDGTASGPGSSAFTLATVNANVGTFTNATITVNAKGLVTAASAGSAGGVTSVTASSPLASSGGSTPNITITGSALTEATSSVLTITGGGAALLAATSIQVTQATTSTSGYLSSTDWNTFNNKQAAGSFISSLTGDVTATGPGAAAATLATVNANTGSFGSPTTIPSFNVNAKGLITAASTNAVIAPAGTLTGTTLASNVVTSSLTSLGVQAQALNMGSHLINAVTDPVSAQDAATKNYVDASVAALQPQTSVYAATTATIAGTYLNGVAGVGATFTTTSTATFTVDGTTPPVGSRILIKNQTSGFQNGIYNLTAAAVPSVSGTVFTRTLDYNTASDMNSAGLIPVINGTVNALSSWQQIATITTVGTDSLVFSEFTANPSLYLLKANNLSDVASASTSFGNISPLTTKGDVLGFDTANNRIPVGTNGQVLTADSTQALGLKWASATGGTVTSVALSAPAEFTVSGSPVTTSGTLTFTKATQNANLVYAGPTSGGAAAPTFRSLVSADVPTLNQNTTGTASNVTGVVAVANGGTGTSTAFTQGSIVFAGASGVYSQDNANFFWDDTNITLGIGKTPTTSTFFDIQKSTASGVVRGILTGYGANQIGYRTRFARGTSGSPTAAQTDDTLVFFNAQGYGATAFPAASTGSMNIVAGQNFTDSAMGTYLRWFTTPSGSVTAAETMRLSMAGNLLIGTTTDNATDKLQVNGTAIATSVKVTGATSGTITISATATAGSNTVTLPAFTGTALVSADNEVILTGGNGFGSTDTVIRRFTTTQRSNGSAMTYTDSATLGMKVVVNTAGVYAIMYADGAIQDNQYGLSVNSNQLTTAIGSITAANRLASPTDPGQQGSVSSTIVVRLAVNDTIRAHCSNNSASNTTADDVIFRMILIGAQ